MGAADFPSWYSASIFGGIGCALLSAAAIASWSLWRRRGVSGKVIGALLVCVVASALDIGPLLWIEYRLNIYGPTLGIAEVAVALVVTAVAGWLAPLATMCWYVLLPAPPAPAPARSARPGVVTPAALNDPARAQAVLESGQPWGTLAPAETSPQSATDASPTRPIALTQRLTLIGRELDNDIVLDDERVSRRHAEIRWERGHIELADYGSMNGTLVNQRAVRGRLPLRDGDILELGSHRYLLKLHASQISEQAGAQDDSTSDDTERIETRKTASASGSFGSGTPLLRLTLLQGKAATSAGGTAGTTWPLSAPVTTIGRDPACGITLADTSISRTHAQITRQPAGYFIADLQSSNGVLLNGQRLTGPAQIFAGDIVALGDCLLRCEEASAEPTVASVTPQPTPDAAVEEPSTPTAPPAPPTIALTPTGVPSFHLRISPTWGARRDSRPRLAPPRLRPTPPQRETPTT